MSPYVNSAGVSLYYERFGHFETVEPPVVWIPGGFGFGPHFSVWDLIDSPRVTRTRAVINFFRRCYGPSAFSAEPASLAQWTNDLLALVDGLGAERVNLMGWSASSIWTLSFAAAHPERCASVVSLNGVFRNAGAGLGRALDIYVDRALSPYDVFLEQQREIVGVSDSSPLRDFSRFYSYLDRESYERQRQELVRHREWCEATVEYFRSIDLTNRLTAIACPVLIIQGLDDRLCDPSEARRAVGLIPRAELLELEGVGHMPTSGLVYDSIAHAVSDFWERHGT